MLAEKNTFPPTPPPGFSYLREEPVFEPKRHLELAAPDERWSLADFGYGKAESRQFASPIAAATPTQFLSDEGIAATQAVLEALQPQIAIHTEEAHGSGLQRIYFGAYRSRFLRDLASCREVTDFLSQVFETPIAAHTMAHLGCQVNFANAKQGGAISHWHHDIVGFTVVLNLHDSDAIEGGHFTYFKGTRDEGERLLAAEGELPAERVMVSNRVPMGHATVMQGSAVLHGAQPLMRGSHRCSIINSYVSRDVTAPDPNRGYLVRNGYPGLAMNPVYCEMVRHAAWRSQAKLGTLLETLPWTEDRAELVSALRAAVEEVEDCAQKLETGDITYEAYLAQQRAADYRQMATPLFPPVRQLKS